jgi:hypothetical protein
MRFRKKRCHAEQQRGRAAETASALLCCSAPLLLCVKGVFRSYRAARLLPERGRAAGSRGAHRPCIPTVARVSR